MSMFRNSMLPTPLVALLTAGLASSMLVGCGDDEETTKPDTELPGEGSEEPGEGSEEPGEGSEEPGEGSEEPGEGSEEPGEEEPWPLDEIGIQGVHVDEYSTSHVITDTTWTIGMGAAPSVFTFEGVWNDEGIAIARNATTNPYSPGLYSRFEWFIAEDGETLYYCQSEYGAESAEAAFHATAPDRTALDTGCGGFTWSILSAPPLEELATTGRFADDYGSVHVLTAGTWQMGEGEGASLFTFEALSNEFGFAIAHNAETNEYSPGLYSRFDWVIDGDQFRYCQTAYGAAAFVEAWMTVPADATDFTTGCGGFAWSELVLLVD